MNMAGWLKGSANLFAGLCLMRAVAGDLRNELRRDSLKARENAEILVRRVPYRAAGVAALLGLLTGAVIGNRYGARISRSPRTIPTNS
jgi:ElaB/YqjD/DUF883 family membrane-anchored ribosome-binding protein